MTSQRLDPAMPSFHKPNARSIREVVFGVNDGLVSITGLVVGVTASNMPSHLIVVAGLAALAAAAIAMGLGAYLSTAAQNEYFAAEKAREFREVHEVPHEERQEVETILRRKGFTEEEVQIVTRRLMSDIEQWVDFMMKEELGIVMDTLDSPWSSGGVMTLAVILGSLPPLIPYWIFPQTSVALHWALVLVVLAAFGLGVLKARVARTVWWRSGVQFTVAAGIAIAVGITVGHLIG